MATITPRGNSFVLNWSEPGPDGFPKQHRLSLGSDITAEQAERARKIKELELAAGVKLDAPGARALAAKSASPTFSEFVDKTYTPWHRAHFPSSREKLAVCMITLRPAFGAMPLHEITAGAVEAWKAARMQERVKRRNGLSTRRVSNETVRKEMAQLFAILRKAVAWGALPKFLCDDVVKVPKVREKLPRFLEKAEIEAICAKAGARGHWWRFMANTGLRRSEALKARRSDLRASGDGRLALAVESTEAGRTKSGGLRVVPLNDAATAALEHLGKDRLFPDITREYFGRLFSRDAARAGVRAGIHTLRHSFGTHLATARPPVPIRVIQRLMGHSSITTTEIYLWTVNGSAEDAVTHINL